MGIHNFCVLLLVIGICSINCLKAYVAWRRSIEFHSMTRNMNQFAVVQSLKTHTLIIGAGVSGLMCANTLSQSNYSDFMIIDCEKVVGGRVQSEIVEGFILDKGFQVFIDSYPESKQIFDYKKLQLKPFNAGALIRFNGTFHLVADPLRQPQKAWQVVQSPIGSFTDKLKVFISRV